jgi:hypothetical protein
MTKFGVDIASRGHKTAGRCCSAVPEMVGVAQPKGGIHE